MPRQASWAFASGAVLGALSAATIAAVTAAAIGGTTPFDQAMSGAIFWIILGTALPGMLAGGAACVLFHSIGALRLSTLLWAAGGALLGFLLSFTWSTDMGSMLDALTLILWEWVMTIIGVPVGRFIESRSRRFD